MMAGILQRLRDSLLPSGETPGVVLVEDIDKLADKGGTLDSGSVVVVPYRERATENRLASGGFRQRVAVQFLTGIIIREYDHAMGADRALQFDGHKTRLEAALAGWTPPAAEDACELVGGESSPIEVGVSIYVQTWETSRFLTGGSP